MGDCPSPAAPWLDKARQDLVAGERMLAEPPVPAPACFHAQQAAEKALKAVAAHAGAQDIPRVHSLLELAELMESLGVEPAFSLEELAFLDPFAVHVRYPDLPEPEADVATRAMELARAIVAWAESTAEPRTEPEEE